MTLEMLAFASIFFLAGALLGVTITLLALTDTEEGI